MARHSVTEFLSTFKDRNARFADHEKDLWICLDGKGCIIQVWPGFTRATGYTESDVLSFPIIDFIDLETLATFIKSFGWYERQPFNMLHKGGGLVMVRMDWYEFLPNECNMILRLL